MRKTIDGAQSQKSRSSAQSDNNGRDWLLMLKRTMILVLCLMALSTMATAEVYEVPENGAPLTLEGDMGLLIDGVWYPILNSFEALKEALGEPNDVISAPSCVFRGEDKEFVYEGMSIYTNPFGELDVWYEAYITDEGFTTTRGIGFGASAEDILAAYGDHFYIEGEGMMTYSISGVPEDYMSPCIIFELKDDVVICVDIYYPTNTL